MRGMADVLTLRVGCEFDYDVAVDTPAVFQVEPYDGPPATVLEQGWTTKPGIALHHYVDLYGNLCQRLTLPAGGSTIAFDAVVAVPNATEEVDLDAPELAPHDLPDEALIFTLASRYVLPDVLGDETWRLFGDVPPGYRRVKAICDFVNGHLRFAYGSSTPLTTAVDVYEAKVGVCRDFTHLAITLCRALNIPARYVFGYLPDIEVELPDPPPPMDFAAWMEVYLGDRWWTFDPRNNEVRKGRVVIGRGRDAGDVAMVTTYGGATLNRMDVVAEPIE
jgi:transglutaminase-like putative cysteine protease